jgi:hypothetical protein
MLERETEMPEKVREAVAAELRAMQEEDFEV